MQLQPILKVDAFTDRAFAGNPAGVCILEVPRSDAWMRNVAMEMNASQSAFVKEEGEGYRLRWFTADGEINICGHATLASAHVLWESDILDKARPALFDTRSGRLTASREDGWIILDFPANRAAPAEAPPLLLDALGVRPCAVLRSSTDYLVEVETPEHVKNVKPDCMKIAKLQARGVIVTARYDDAGFDFVSRFFAPAVGTNEDPATGTTHCTLGPYWADKLGKQALTGYQASRRGGTIRVEVKDDRVLLGGKAVTALRGEIVTE